MRRPRTNADHREGGHVQIAVLLYRGFTALDCIGPYDVLARLPDANVVFTAAARGEVRTETQMLGITADAALDEITAPDVLLIPGGFGTRALMTDEPTLAWIRAVHEHTTWTTSVCTGSLLLGAAGLLDGLDATTHWASAELLESTGARYTEQRVVRQGKIVTAAGVSAGIDMALELSRDIAGDTYAQGIQLSIEYDPQPPFDCGSPSKASPELVELVTAAMNERSSDT
jgi:putative intracellular protease/amidase